MACEGALDKAVKGVPTYLGSAGAWDKAQQPVTCSLAARGLLLGAHFAAGLWLEQQVGCQRASSPTTTTQLPVSHSYRTANT